MSCCGKKPSKRKQPSRFRHLKPKNLVQTQGVALKTFLMCRPSFFAIKYSINPWMSISNRADNKLAMEQWNNLCDRIKEHGGDIRFIKERPEVPDMVFTANGGTTFKGKKVAISNFKHKERKEEEAWFIQWFVEEGWTFSYTPDHSYEGAGDVLPLNDTLVCGTGFRSEPEAHQIIQEVWGGPILPVKLVDPHFYHLDTCFCPLADGDYLIHSAAFDNESLKAIQALPNTRGIVVPVEEAILFACNAVCIGKTVILPAGCLQTMKLLQDHGYNPIEADISEFLKAGGGCKCLTLEI